MHPELNNHVEGNRGAVRPNDYVIKWIYFLQKVSLPSSM
jgi:hypothetical protein